MDAIASAAYRLRLDGQPGRFAAAVSGLRPEQWRAQSSADSRRSDCKRCPSDSRRGHLSQPFAETLDAIKRYREWAEFSARAPWHFVQMSATLREDRDTFATGDDDLTHPGLGPRLNAHKRAALIQVKCEAADERDSRQRKRELEAANANVLVEEVCEQARALRGGTPPTGVVAVILNRVASARTAFQRLRTEPQAEAILLTGRGRPYDRDRLIESWKSRLEAGRSRDEGKGLLFVVATQCIEVGANFDFDALVTECAALDALRQRLAGSNRWGRWASPTRRLSHRHRSDQGSR